jgi:PhnB protein
MATATKVNPIPTGYHTITPYLTVKGADKLIDFLKQAFGAKEKFRMPGPDGRVMHAELEIGDSRLMLGDGRDQYPTQTAQLYLYVDDCDRYYKQALAAGATSHSEPATQFYGDRHGAVKDSWGNIWWTATHVEDVSQEEMERRMKAMKK